MTTPCETDPPWIATLVCGASGVGKSHAARGLAARYNAPIGEADDIVTALKAITTSEHHPLLHSWENHPEAADWDAERIADLHLAVADALLPAFRAVIADHVESGAPIVLEGDYLLPELAAEEGVRAFVLTDDAQRITENYRSREPDQGDQSRRAKVSTLISDRLARRAGGIGIPVIPARPWPDTLDRIDQALRAAPPA